MWFQVALFVASILISAAMMPSVNAQQANPPEALADIDFPQADEGTPQAVFFGDCWTSDWMVLAVGNYRTTPIMSDGGGGK